MDEVWRCLRDNAWLLIVLALMLGAFVWLGVLACEMLGA